MTAIYSVELDTDKDGTFDAAVDNITAYVIDASIHSGFDNEMAHTANIGQCFMTVNNADRRFSPAYAAGPLYGKLTPRLPMRIRATVGATTYTLFRGYLVDPNPSPGVLGDGFAVLTFEDSLSLFEQETIEIPPQMNCTGDRLVKMIGADVFKTVANEYTIEIFKQPVVGEYCRIATVNYGQIQYNFKSSLTTAKDVLIGADKEATAQNLIYALNGDDEGLDTNYYQGTVPIRDATATGATGTAYGGAGVSKTGSGGAIPVGPDPYPYVSFQRLVVSAAQAGLINQVTIKWDANVGSPTGNVVYQITNSLTITSPRTYNVDTTMTGTVTPSAGNTSTINIAAADQVFSTPGDWFIMLWPESTQAPGNYWQWQTGTGGGTDCGYYTIGGGGLPTYGAGDAQCSLVMTAVTAYNITLKAAARGTWANTLSKVSGGGKWGGFLSEIDGTDGPTGLLSTETGDRPLAFAGATWESNKTTGWRALDDVARSEFGYIWIARDGTLTFKNKNWEFTRFLATPTLTIAGTHQDQRPASMAKRIINACEVSRVPGDQTSSGTVAQSLAPFSVPGKSFLTGATWPRTNRLSGYSGKGAPAGAAKPGDKLLRLPFSDASGNRIGARDLITPVPNTDYTVNDEQDGSGYNYTLKKQIAVSLAPSGSGVEVSFKNNATGPLWIRDFKIRGTQIQQFSPETVKAEDADSIADYGKRPVTHHLAFDSGAPFAEAITYYVIGRYADPVYVVEKIIFEGPETVGGVNLLAVELGDVLVLSEDQTAVSTQKYLVRAIDYDIQMAGQIVDAIFTVKRLDQFNYFIIDHATYGILDSGAVLAL